MAFSLVDPAVSAASSGVSEIDVLVLYTPAAAAYAGGEASMRAEVERLFGETNTAFRNSGVSARVGGWARAVSYVESQDVSTDLGLLKGAFDGYLDDVHSMRSDLGADLVHLLVAFTPPSSSDGSYTCGIADTRLRASAAFGVTLFYPGCRYTFTHELGHNLGLWHDRYQHFTYGSFASAHVPYAYGYSNAATFSPIAGGQCWYTVMAYYKHCFDVPGGRGFVTPVLLFSSPYRRHPSSGEPLGVFGEVETSSVDGPADAARALERTRAHVAAYYRRPDPPVVTGVDLAVWPGTVSISPVVVDVGESVFVQASVANNGAGFVSSSTVSFWSQYDESGAEWVRRASKTPGGLSADSSKTVTWRGTGGSDSGTEYWAVCIAASGDVDPDNDCALAGETVVIRDPDAVEGGELVADSSGELAAGATGEIEFAVNDVTGEEFQIQPHWFLLGYEPVDEDVWGAISGLVVFRGGSERLLERRRHGERRCRVGLARSCLGLRFRRVVPRSPRHRGLLVVRGRQVAVHVRGGHLRRRGTRCRDQLALRCSPGRRGPSERRGLRVRRGGGFGRCRRGRHVARGGGPDSRR